MCADPSCGDDFKSVAVALRRFNFGEEHEAGGRRISGLKFNWAHSSIPFIALITRRIEHAGRSIIRLARDQPRCRSLGGTVEELFPQGFPNMKGSVPPKFAFL